MENSVWRPRARIVAVADMLIASISLAVSVVIVSVAMFSVALCASAREEIESGEISGKEADGTRFVKIMECLTESSILWWMVGAIVLVGLQVWAAAKLLSATGKDLSVQKALQRAKIWICVTVAIFILNFGLQLFSVELCLSIAGYFVIRGIFLFVVYKFMKDLQGVESHQRMNAISVCSI